MDDKDKIKSFKIIKKGKTRKRNECIRYTCMFKVSLIGVEVKGKVIVPNVLSVYGT